MIAPPQRHLKQQARESFVYSAVVWVTGLCLVLIFSLNSYAELLFAREEPNSMNRAMFPASQTPSRLAICDNEVISATDFAIVSLVTSDGDIQNTYQPAIKALGNSVQSHTNLDMIVITSLPLLIVQHTGWKVCYAQNVTEILVWRLGQYKAVLLVTLDTLVIRDPTSLFTTYYDRMLLSNKTLGAVSKSLCPTHSMKMGLSTAVLLVIPSSLTYLRMVKKRILHQNYTHPHGDFGMLVRSTFQNNDHFFELPMEYNANVKTKFCNPEWWSSAPIKILHFTMVKPWSLLSTSYWEFGKLHPWACWASGLSDACEMWKRVWAQT